jgi:hypothetical protein
MSILVKNEHFKVDDVKLIDSIEECDLTWFDRGQDQ